MFLHRFSKVRAPEFPQRLSWINSESLSMKKMLGKVVLIDFWTYSCVNCLRTQPHLNNWYKTYEEKGLVIVGVHTPEFSFEKEKSNVENAVKKMKINYPVVLDPDYKIWNLYANRWWPRKFLIDAKGYVVYDHVGEGGYAETEHAIQKALHEIGVSDLPAIEPDSSVGGGICYRTTPETYLGFLRGRYGNRDRFVPNTEHVFTDSDEHEEDLVYLHGHFKVSAENIEHTKKLSIKNEYIGLKYSAFSVNLVMASSKSSKVFIELDGQPLPEDMAGEDVKYINGKAVVNVNQSRMYRLVDSDNYHRGMLKLKTADAGVKFFAFTFGGCKGM